MEKSDTTGNKEGDNTGKLGWVEHKLWMAWIGTIYRREDTVKDTNGIL